jgi:hypothetical protein
MKYTTSILMTVAALLTVSAARTAGVSVMLMATTAIELIVQYLYFMVASFVEYARSQESGIRSQ